MAEKEKIFKVAHVRDLLNQVHNDEITFSRFVELLEQSAKIYHENELKKLQPTKTDEVNEEGHYL